MIPFRNYHDIKLDRVYCIALLKRSNLDDRDRKAYESINSNISKWRYKINSTQRVAWQAARDTMFRENIGFDEALIVQILFVIGGTILLWIDRNIHKLG